MVVQPFSREFAAIPAREFVRDFFVERLKVREVVIGHDYCFGHKPGREHRPLEADRRDPGVHRPGGVGRGGGQGGGEQFADPGHAAPGEDQGGEPHAGQDLRRDRPGGGREGQGGQGPGGPHRQPGLARTTCCPQAASTRSGCGRGGKGSPGSPTSAPAPPSTTRR